MNVGKNDTAEAAEEEQKRPEAERPELSDDPTEPLLWNQVVERDIGEPKSSPQSEQTRLVGLDGGDGGLAHSDDNAAPIPIDQMFDQDDSLAKDGPGERRHETSTFQSQPDESDAEDSSRRRPPLQSQQSSIPEATLVAEEPIYHAEEVFEGSLAPEVYDGVVMEEDESSNLSEALLDKRSTEETEEEEDAKRPWYKKNCFRKPRFSLMAVIIIVIVALLVMDDDAPPTKKPTKKPTNAPTGAPSKAPTGEMTFGAPSLRQRNVK